MFPVDSHKNGRWSCAVKNIKNIGSVGVVLQTRNHDFK